MYASHYVHPISHVWKSEHAVACPESEPSLAELLTTPGHEGIAHCCLQSMVDMHCWLTRHHPHVQEQCREEGFAGLWKGVTPNIGRNAIINAAELASYDSVSSGLVIQSLVQYLGMCQGHLLHLLRLTEFCVPVAWPYGLCCKKDCKTSALMCCADQNSPHQDRHV